jgi:tripartite-type tricarboxylate transporter receptor subunit TctC
VLIAAAGAAALAALRARAQSFPSRPITLICPWPAGGSTDRHMRALAELASKYLGQPVIVENKPGGGGTTGPGTMALTAKPDGYTISQYPMGMLRVPHMQKVQWDPLKDFTFMLGVSGYTFGLTVRADSPFKSFKEYIEAARKEPGKIDYGSTGVGTSPHLLMEELAINAKVTLNHIPFKGNADLQQALLGGHVMAQSDASGWDKYVDGGQMRLLVTFGEKRTKRWPRCPPPGAGLRRGLDLAVRPGRPQGHGPGRREDPARRLQEGDGRPQAHRAAGPAEPGRLVPQRRRLREVGARHLRQGQAADRKARAGGEVTSGSARFGFF